MSDVLFLIGWAACGTLAVLIYRVNWRGIFGSMRDFPWWLMIIVWFGGPLGLISAGASWVIDRGDRQSGSWRP